MKKILLILLLCFSLKAYAIEPDSCIQIYDSCRYDSSCPLPSQLAVSNCGGEERWDVKTLTDVGISQIIFRTSKTVSVRYMVNLPTVKVGRSTSRYGVEDSVYTVRCRIREFFSEADDDIHIVMEDVNDNTITMIGEIPNPDCDTATTSKFDTAFPGTAFTDLKHPKPQRGVAKNAIEVHPLIRITKEL